MSAGWRWRLMLVILFAGGFLAVYIPGILVLQNLDAQAAREEGRLNRMLVQNSLLNVSLRLQSRIDLLEGDPLLQAAPCSRPAGDDRWQEWLERLAGRSNAEEIRILASDRLLVAARRHPASFGRRMPQPEATEIERLFADRDGSGPRPVWIVRRPLPECPWLEAEWIWDWDEDLGRIEAVPPGSGAAASPPNDRGRGPAIIKTAGGEPVFALAPPVPGPAAPGRSPGLKMLLPAIAGGLLVMLIGWILLLPLRRAWRRIETETEGAWRRAGGLGRLGDGQGKAPSPDILLRALSEEALGLAAQAERLAAVAGWKDVGRALGHDIRNALTPLRLTVGTLAIKSDDPRLAPALQAAQGSLERVQRLVEEFSHFARLPEGVLKIADLNRVIRSIVDTWPEQDPPHAAFQPAAQGPLRVRVDPGHMDRIVQNLIKNAREAAGPAGEVAISCTRRAERAEIRVWNSGPPIPEGMLEEIFRRGLSTKSGGQGLGLAIARELVTRMGGRIRAENPADGGVAFVVDLPLVRE